MRTTLWLFLSACTAGPIDAEANEAGPAAHGAWDPRFAPPGLLGRVDSVGVADQGTVFARGRFGGTAVQVWSFRAERGWSAAPAAAVFPEPEPAEIAGALVLQEHGGLAPGEAAPGLVRAVARHPAGGVVVAGDFDAANGVPARGIVWWTGREVVPLVAEGAPTGAVRGRVEAMAARGAHGPFAAGDFTHALGRTRDELARERPLGFTPVRTPTEADWVTALAVGPDGELVFATTTCAREGCESEVAFADGTRVGVPGRVREIEVDELGVYVGGSFGLRRRQGAQLVDVGLDAEVMALHAPGDGGLLVALALSAGGGLVLRWDGRTFAALLRTKDTITSLATSAGRMYVGTEGEPALLALDGAAPVAALPASVRARSVSALATRGDELYALGEFVVDGEPRHLVGIEGERASGLGWFDVPPAALTACDSGVWLAGDFTTVDGLPSVGLARLP